MRALQNIVFLLAVSLHLANCGTAQKKAPGQNQVYTLGEKTRDGLGKYYMGREIAHMMGPGGMEWLERSDRNEEENTSLAIEKMNLKPGMVVADIGAGSGYYSFKMAKQLGPGKVYAIDVQEEMLQQLRAKKKGLGLSNIDVIKGDSTHVNLPENSVDLAFMVDVYHELAYPHEMLQSIKKALKPGGILILIEYRGEDPAIPIKALHKMTISQVDKELTANGFNIAGHDNSLPIQHFLRYQK